MGDGWCMKWGCPTAADPTDTCEMVAKWAYGSTKGRKGKCEVSVSGWEVGV
jgi:hypothetical protein